MASFTLDHSTLGGLAFNYLESPELEERGRGIFLTWEQKDANVGMELLGYSVRYAPAEKTSKESA